MSHIRKPLADADHIVHAQAGLSVVRTGRHQHGKSSLGLFYFGTWKRAEFSPENCKEYTLHTAFIAYFQEGRESRQRWGSAKSYLQNSVHQHSTARVFQLGCSRPCPSIIWTFLRFHTSFIIQKCTLCCHIIQDTLLYSQQYIPVKFSKAVPLFPGSARPESPYTTLLGMGPFWSWSFGYNVLYLGRSLVSHCTVSEAPFLHCTHLDVVILVSLAGLLPQRTGHPPPLRGLRTDTLSSSFFISDLPGLQGMLQPGQSFTVNSLSGQVELTVCDGQPNLKLPRCQKHVSSQMAITESYWH